MILRFDTREQNPLVFPLCDVSRGTISVFDYALEGDHDAFSIERKSFSDLIQSLALKDNFERELKKISRARAAGMEKVFYVVECTRSDIEKFDFSWFKSGKVTPEFIYQRISTLEYFNDVHMIFSGDAAGAARDVYRLLKRRQEHLHLMQAEEPESNLGCESKGDSDA